MPTEKRDIPPIPGFCTSADCSRPPREPFLVLARVEDEHYQQAVGPASMFKVNGQWKHGITVKGWETRCAACFETDPPGVERSWSGG